MQVGIHEFLIHCKLSEISLWLQGFKYNELLILSDLLTNEYITAYYFLLLQSCICYIMHEAKIKVRAFTQAYR